MPTKRQNAAWQKAYRERQRAPDDPSHSKTRYGFLRWAQESLKVPVGLRSGKPFKVQDWQARFICEGRSEAGLCVARKNGKTGLVAAYLLRALLHEKPGWSCVVASLMGSLSKKLLNAAKAIAKTSRPLNSEMQQGGAGRLEVEIRYERV